MPASPGLRVGWGLAIVLAVGVRAWNALGPLLWGYDAGGHLQYVLYLDVYRALPWADQGWSLFHPPLHYALGWLLAQLGSGELLMRGLLLLAGAESLGIAGCAAWLLRRLAPGQPGLALLAFCAVAFVPVQLSVGTMPGNEMTQGFLSAAALASFVANQLRSHPSLRGDARTGVLLGLALLTKHNALIVLAGLAGSLVLLGLLAIPPLRALARALTRLAVLAGVALVLAAPIYLRNIQAFGTPFPAAGDFFPLVRLVESRQPPGERSWRDYVSFPLRLFSQPDPLAPHLLHSVWGSLYLNAWSETHNAPPERTMRQEFRVRSSMAALGLLPTALALVGAALAARDAWRGRCRPVYLPLLVLCGAGAAAIVGFSWRVPTWAALKASYLLPLSLPWAVFLCRAMGPLAKRPALRVTLLGALGVVAAAAAIVSAPGALLPERPDTPAAAAVYYHFGEYEQARRILAALPSDDPPHPILLDNMAAVELADGRPDRARELYLRAAEAVGGVIGPEGYRPVSLAIATALDGDLAKARRLLDELIEERPFAEAFANRGAVRAAQGKLGGAQRDLEAALERDPSLTVAWLNLARVRERMGQFEPARAARERAAQEACRAPRGPIYGRGGAMWTLGHGLLLLWDEDELRPALADFRRGACRELYSR